MSASSHDVLFTFRIDPTTLTASPYHFTRSNVQSNVFPSAKPNNPIPRHPHQNRPNNPHSRPNRRRNQHISRNPRLPIPNNRPIRQTSTTQPTIPRSPLPHKLLLALTRTILRHRPRTPPGKPQTNSLPRIPSPTGQKEYTPLPLHAECRQPGRKSRYSG